MKTYIYDKGWAGAIVVVADSRPEASEIATAAGLTGWNMTPVDPEEWQELGYGEATQTVGDC